MRFSQRSAPLRLLVVALATVLVGIGGVSLARAQNNQVCFPETGFCTSERFLSFWQENGGLSAFGFPITAQGTELIQGQPFEVQWFERQRFERHPENAAPFDVLLGRLGADRLAQLGLNWFDFPKADPAVAAANRCIFVPETGHSICGGVPDGVSQLWPELPRRARH
ncbi:hypothetical protein HC891_17055 [Candidatus Gracilibacteria bacterium]|nr:hypothetical protein [Candidatus Gracilibacteria bacterium]